MYVGRRGTVRLGLDTIHDSTTARDKEIAGATIRPTSKILLVRWGPSGPPIPRFALSVFFLYHLWWLTHQVLHPSTTVSFFSFSKCGPPSISRGLENHSNAGLRACSDALRRARRRVEPPDRASGSALRLPRCEKSSPLADRLSALGPPSRP